MASDCVASDCVASDCVALHLLLEDDVKLHVQWQRTLRDCLPSLPSDWKALRLHAGCGHNADDQCSRCWSVARTFAVSRIRRRSLELCFFSYRCLHILNVFLGVSYLKKKGLF